MKGLPEPGDVIADKYRVDEHVGAGGMGAVFAATHLVTGRRVALKWMRPEVALDAGAIERFIREAQAAGRVHHPSIVDVHDVGEHGGAFYMVMEWVPGRTLAEHLEATGPMPLRDACALLLPAMRGVEAAHAAGVIHRDLKPDNIMLVEDAEGRRVGVKVLDFGISKIRDHGPRERTLTSTGEVFGTPSYMSPEQARDAKRVDARTDVFAFGAILYQLVTGSTPFAGDDYLQVLRNVGAGTFRRPRELRPEISEPEEAIICKAMAREPGDRFHDMGALIAALQALPAAPAADTRVRPAGVRARPWLVLSVVALGLLVFWQLWWPVPEVPSGAARPASSAAAAPPVGDARPRPAPAVLTAPDASVPTPDGPRPARQEARPRKASLKVVAIPFGEVFVNGEARGRSPISLRLEPGKHDVRVVLPAGERVRTVELRAGQRRELVLR